MMTGFTFVHDGRTYACRAEESWWWFTVTRDANRYAPFRAAARDTRSSVRSRIVAYYLNHLAHRAMTERDSWERRPKPAVAAAKGK